jgi:hypothetical protein
MLGYSKGTIDFFWLISHTFAAMAKKTNSKPTVPALPAPINPDGVKSVYVNNMEAQFSSMDARLTFNEIIADHGTITVERRAHVVMPLQHVAAMVQALNDAMSALQQKIKEQPGLAEKK